MPQWYNKCIPNGVAPSFPIKTVSSVIPLPHSAVKLVSSVISLPHFPVKLVSSVIPLPHFPVKLVTPLLLLISHLAGCSLYKHIKLHIQCIFFLSKQTFILFYTASMAKPGEINVKEETSNMGRGLVSEFGREPCIFFRFYMGYIMCLLPNVSVETSISFTLVYKY